MTVPASPFQPKVVYEDEALLVLDKPAGLLVHPTPKRPDETSLEQQVAEWAGKRYILLHRLDRDTTGLVLFAKTKTAAGPMSRAFEEGRIRKAYFAVVSGHWPKELQRFSSYLVQDPQTRGWVNRTEGPGHEAVTTFRWRAQEDERTLLEVLPKTGRTHQIRLHCQACGHPIEGDRLYNPQARADDLPQALHAYRVDISHPLTKAPMRLTVAPPWAERYPAFFAEISRPPKPKK